jgi:hypothetical protein
MLLYLHASKAVPVVHQRLMGLLDTTQDDQSSMPRVLHILHLRDAMMQAKREQPQAEYYSRLKVPNSCSGQLCVVSIGGFDYYCFQVSEGRASGEVLQ